MDTLNPIKQIVQLEGTLLRADMVRKKPTVHAEEDSGTDRLSPIKHIGQLKGTLLRANKVK